MKTRLAIFLALLLGTFQLAACAAPAGDAVSPETTTQEDMAAVEQSIEPNFLLVVSDEANDIGDFTELWVTVSGIGFVQGDGEGIVEVQLDPAVEINLVEFQDEDAVDVWEGYVPDGDYTKIFLYVNTTVTGTLAETKEEIEVKLPSNKLQLTIPVTVGDEPEAETTDFVFDITVQRDGNNGQYSVTPQISESGEGKQYRLLQHTQERVREGKADWPGKPDDPGKPENAGKPEETGTGAQGGPPEDAGKPDDGGKRVEIGTPSSAVIPGEHEGSGGNNQQS